MIAFEPFVAFAEYVLERFSEFAAEFIHRVLFRGTECFFAPLFALFGPLAQEIIGVRFRWLYRHGFDSSWRNVNAIVRLDRENSAAGLLCRGVIGWAWRYWCISARHGLVVALISSDRADEAWIGTAIIISRDWCPKNRG